MLGGMHITLKPSTGKAPWELSIPPRTFALNGNALKKLLRLNRAFLSTKLENISKCCPICRSEVKSFEHALLLCDPARGAWCSSPTGLLSHNIQEGML